MATERSRTPSVHQPCWVVEGSINRRFEKTGAVMERSLRETRCVISGLRRGVNEALAILGCYATLIASYRRFGTAYWYHLQDSGSSNVLVTDVSGQIVSKRR